jgi:quercetin dioxygenase-like cupin family protein
LIHNIFRVLAAIFPGFSRRNREIRRGPRYDVAPQAREERMALEVRRIVTGHDAKGKAIVTTDEKLQAVSRLGRPHIAGCEIWSTDRMPVDNSEAADAAQRTGYVKRYNYVGTGQGTVIRITEFAPGAPKFMHRTETVDYALLLSGECDLELDSGEIVHMKPGDVVVQRGTMHAWVNNGPAPCVFAFILIDANAAVAGGQELRTHFPAP